MSIIDREKLVVVGGGIGGLATAIACIQKGMAIQLIERTPQYSHVGAGIQLGPNATRILQGWGLGQALERLAAFPDKLLVRSAPSGRELASLSLGSRCQQRYGAPYATLHRADLHSMLLDSVRLRPEVKLHLNSPVTGYTDTPEGVQLAWADGYSVEGDALIGADGFFSGLVDFFDQ